MIPRILVFFWRKLSLAQRPVRRTEIDARGCTASSEGPPIRMMKPELLGFGHFEHLAGLST
jgi:hypothetical protein